MNKQKSWEYLKQLGLEPEEAKLYVELAAGGVMTALELSRASKINRTKVYRTLEAMEKRGLVSEEVGEHTTKYSPAPLDKLKELLRLEQKRVAGLTSSFNEIEEFLTQKGAERQADTIVKYYRGIEGVRQMVWNVLSAKSEIVGYTTRDLTDFVGEKFMQEFTEEFVRRKLSMRDIHSDEYVKNHKVEWDWGAKTKSRYLPPEVLSLPHQMDIYDEVVTFYNYHEGEVWGTEIYNEKVAQVQKQLFEIAWERAGTE